MKIESGYLDFHVHVGEKIGGYTLRDDFHDLAKLCAVSDDPQKVALAGMAVFVTQAEGRSLKNSFEQMQEKAARDFPAPVFWHLTPVQDSVEEVVSLLQKGVDLKFYTTYKAQGLYKSYAEIDRWMQDLSSQKTRILVHCEDDALVSEYAGKHPFRHPKDHCLRRPEICEITAVERILDLALKNQHPVHIVHVSSPRAAILIHEAKKHFAGITCETAPHYLLHSERDLEAVNAHRLLCTPPFRSESSRGLHCELLADGYFDILASDHCAFRTVDKDRYKNEPGKVPNGIPGIAELYSSVYDAFVRTGKISQDHLERMTRTRVLELMQS